MGALALIRAGSYSCTLFSLHYSRPYLQRIPFLACHRPKKAWLAATKLSQEMIAPILDDATVSRTCKATLREYIRWLQLRGFALGDPGKSSSERLTKTSMMQYYSSKHHETRVGEIACSGRKTLMVIGTTSLLDHEGGIDLLGVSQYGYSTATMTFWW